MATSSSTTKAKPENPNLTRTRSISRKPKQPSSVSSDDGGDQKPEKPLPNYLRPTFSSSPDQVKLVKKNNNTLDDHQKLLRRKSFDRAPSSIPAASTSSTRIQKTLNNSPSLPRDKASVPKEKPVAALRSSSFHGSRGVPRGGPVVKSPPVAPKKSGLSSSSSSLKSKKQVSENVKGKKVSEKEVALDTASLSSAQEDEEEILKAEIDVQVADDIEEPKVEKENKEVQVEAVHVDEPSEENEISREPTLVASPVVEDIVVAKEIEKEEEQQQLINEDKPEEKIEETKEQENTIELKEEVKSKIDEPETSEKVETDNNSPKEVESVVETMEEEEVKEEEIEKVKEEEIEKVTEEEKEEVKEEKIEEVKEEKKEKEKVKEEETGEGKKKEVVKAKNQTPSAYNDVIASTMQQNPRKNKVLALAGAFQTVIDYETAASK